LEDAGDGDFDGTADHFAGVVDDYHGAVVEIADALVVLLAFLEDEDIHVLAGEDDRLEGVGEVVDVQDVDVMEMGDLVEVEVVGDDLGFPFFGKFEELEIDFADGREIVRDDLDLKDFVGLHALEHVKTAAAALALGAIGGVGYDLEFAEDELGNDDHAVDEAGFGDVGDAAVDDDAGIEDLGAAAGGLVAGEEHAEGGGIEEVALAGSDEQSDVAHEQQNEDLDHGRTRSRERRRAEDETEESSAKDAEDAAGDSADETAQTEGADSQFEDNDGCSRNCTGCTGNEAILYAERVEKVADRGKKGNKKKTNQDQIHISPTFAGGEL